mgnify:CR=1 FL=1
MLVQTMLYVFNNKILYSKEKFRLVGQICFYVGIFFLPSSILLASIPFLISAIIGSFLNNKNYFNDIWNKLFFSCGILMITNILFQNFFIEDLYTEQLDPKLSFIGLGNWIPYFWLFWSFQIYLDSSSKRKKISLILISGTLPVLVSGLGQYFFSWYGPFTALNGLIIWFQRPININDGLTGLFSSPNYAGSWLIFIWPLCISLFLDSTKNYLKKTLSICFLTSVGMTAFLTHSRNAWLGLILSVPIVVGSESFIWLGIIFSFIFLIISICIFPIFEGEFQNYLRVIIPEKIWMEFSDKGFEELDIKRIEIILQAIKISFIRPLIGLGASAFTTIFALKTGFWKGHSHNLIIELAISYGIPLTILLVLTVLALLINSGKTLFLNKYNNIYEKAWWTSIFVFIVSQFMDIQYFEGRISLLSWILLSGVKKIIDEKDEKFLNEKINS